MTKTQKLASLAAAFVLVITNLENVSAFFGLSAIPIRAAGLLTVAILITLALVERKPSKYIAGSTVHTIAGRLLRSTLWSIAVIFALGSFALLLYTYWLADRFGASRYRDAVAKEHSYYSLLGKALVRPITTLVIPGLVRHQSFRTIVDPRDSLEMLLLGDGSLYAPPQWIMGHENFWRMIDLSAKVRNPEHESPPARVTLDMLTKAPARVVIVGRPGVNLHQFRRYLTHEYATDSSGHIPVVVNLESLISHDALLNAIKDTFESESWITTAADIRKYFSSGRMVLLVENFQSSGTSRDTDARATLLANLAQRYPLLSIIVFGDTRSMDSPIPNYAIVELIGFTEKQQDQYATLLLDSDSKAKAFREHLVAHPRLRRLASNQLILTLMCLIFEEKGALPTETVAFYDDVLETLMDEAGHVAPKDREAVRKVLGAVALKMVGARTDKISEAEIRRVMTSGRNGPDEIARYDLVLRSGLLSRATRDQFSFAHPMIQDYLAAEELVRADWQVTFDRLQPHVGDYYWQQVIAFAAARYGWRFVRRLLDVPDDMFMTRHFIVDHIMRSGLLTLPPEDIVRDMVSFHKHTARSSFALQRYRSLAAMIDWLFIGGENPAAGACAVLCKELGLPDLSMLNDPDINVRRKGARYVARVVGLAAANERGADRRSRSLLPRLVRDTPDADLRLEMLAYANFDEGNTALLRDELRAACEREDSNRFRIYRVLMERAVPAATPLLLDALSCARNDEDRRREIGAYLRSDMTIKSSIRQVVSKKREMDVRTLEIATYADIALPSAMVRRALHDDDQDVRIAAIDYIAARRDSTFAEELLRYSDDDATANDIAHIVHALADIGKPLSEKKLLALLKRDDPGFRAVALYALRVHGTESARRAIRLSTRDSHPLVRQVAVDALGYLRDGQSLDELFRLIEAPNESVEMKMACMQALVNISGERVNEKMKQYALGGPFPLSMFASAAIDQSNLDRETITTILDRPQEAIAIALASGLSRDSEHFEYVMSRFARSKRVTERLQFAMVAPELDDEIAGELLMPLLDDPVPPVRDAAFVSLYIVTRRSGITGATRLPS